tara:strand:- start:540 stop:728 length:189 start_codon:yes stop_codon:yes gene_type:complete
MSGKEKKVSPCCKADFEEAEGSYCCNARISESGLCYECHDHAESEGYFCNDCYEGFEEPVTL